MLWGQVGGIRVKRPRSYFFKAIRVTLAGHCGYYSKVGFSVDRNVTDTTRWRIEYGSRHPKGY